MSMILFCLYQNVPEYLIVLISISKEEAHKLKFLFGHQKKLKTNQIKLPPPKKKNKTIKYQRAVFISFQIEAEKHQ